MANLILIPMLNFNFQIMNNYLGIKDIKNYIDEQWFNLIVLKKQQELQQELMEEFWLEQEELRKKTFKKELIVEKKQKIMNWSSDIFILPIRND